jgi:hypothetical protein
MEHGPEHTIEHGEHAIHSAHNPFDRRVAMTIAIVAAALACITMLSHRAHNETLLYQTEANILHTQATDKWNYYQSKNLLNKLYKSQRYALNASGKDPARASEHDAAQKYWSEEIEKYDKRLPKMEEDAHHLEEEAEVSMKKSREMHHQADRFDWGELAVEMAVVLCSVAVLTKQAGFWYSGIGMGVLGAGIAISAFFLH